MANNRIMPKTIGAIVATGLMSFCGVVVETAMNITFPTLMKEFNVPTSTVQWMTTLYLLVVATLVPLSATLKRRFSARNLFIWAICLFITGVVLDAVAPSFWLLLAGRGIQGLGTGIALPLMFNIILEEVPPAKIGMMMGVGTMITGVAPAVGPTFGGLVVSALGWRDIFWFLLPVLIVSLVLGLVCIHGKRPVNPAPMDWPSVALIVVTFCGLLFGLSSFGSTAFVSWSVLGALVIGCIGLALLIRRTLTSTHPIVNLRLLSEPVLRTSLLAFICLQVTALALSFLLPNAIQLVNGSTALVAGLILLPGAALGAVLGPLGGRLLDRIGAAGPLRAGALCCLISLAGMAVMGHHLSNAIILVLYVFFMAGMGLSYGNLMTNGLAVLKPTVQTDGNALYNTAQQFFAAVGTSLAAAIVSANQAGAQTMAAGTQAGTQTTMLLLVALSLIEGGLILHVTHKRNA